MAAMAERTQGSEQPLGFMDAHRVRAALRFAFQHAEQFPPTPQAAQAAGETDTVVDTAGSPAYHVCVNALKKAVLGHSKRRSVLYKEMLDFACAMHRWRVLLAAFLTWSQHKA